jgi:predicted dinucleotide-binding enzyme
VKVLPLAEAATSAAVVVVAVPRSTFKSLPFDLLHPDQILVDCSNRHRSRASDLSHAEELKALVGQRAAVVKGLNVLSAYALSRPNGVQAVQDVQGGGLDGSNHLTHDPVLD